MEKIDSFKEQHKKTSEKSQSPCFFYWETCTHFCALFLSSIYLLLLLDYLIITSSEFFQTISASSGLKTTGM